MPTRLMRARSRAMAAAFEATIEFWRNANIYGLLRFEYGDLAINSSGIIMVIQPRFGFVPAKSWTT